MNKCRHHETGGIFTQPRIGIFLIISRTGENQKRRCNPCCLLVELLAQGPYFGQFTGCKPPNHQFQVASVNGHPELGLGSQTGDVTGIFLGRIVQPNRGVFQLRILILKILAQLLIKQMVIAVLRLDHAHEIFQELGILNFLWHQEIIAQGNIALRLLSKGVQAVVLNCFDCKSRQTDDIEVKDRMFCNRMVPHFKYNCLV